MTIVLLFVVFVYSAEMKKNMVEKNLTFWMFDLLRISSWIGLSDLEKLMFSVRKSVNFRDYCHFLVGCHYKKIQTLLQMMWHIEKGCLLLLDLTLVCCVIFFNYLLEFTLPISSSLSVIYKKCLKTLYYGFIFLISRWKLTACISWNIWMAKNDKIWCYPQRHKYILNIKNTVIWQVTLKKSYFSHLLSMHLNFQYKSREIFFESFFF